MTKNKDGFEKMKKRFSKIISLYMVILASFLVIPGITITPVWTTEFQEAPEELIKAAYLYKFLFFIKWPENFFIGETLDNEITIGILGDDSFGDHFRSIEGRIIKSTNRKNVSNFSSYCFFDGLFLFCACFSLQRN